MAHIIDCAVSVEIKPRYTGIHLSKKGRTRHQSNPPIISWESLITQPNNINTSLHLANKQMWRSSSAHLHPLLTTAPANTIKTQLNTMILRQKDVWCNNYVFITLLALCEGNPSFPGGFPSQRPVTRSSDVSFDLCLTKRQSLICKVSFDNLMIILVQKGIHFHYFYEIKPGWLWRMTSRELVHPLWMKIVSVAPWR